MTMCLLNDCPRERVNRHGYCNRHYLRWRRHGSPTAGGVERGLGLAFFMRALSTETDECIDWPYGQSHGYGEVQFEGRTRIAHTLMCEQAHGPRPAQWTDSAHRCGRRICINKRHLRWATRAENVADMDVHGTRLQGEKHPSAKLTEESVRDIRRLRGKVTQDVLAARFGVHRAHIKDIQQRRRWKFLPDMADAR